MPASGRDLAKTTDTALANPEVKNLIFGEVVHTDNTFFQHFVSVENMDSLKRNKVSEIAIELPSMLQFTVESLQAGRMTPLQFKNNMKAQFHFFDMDNDTANERRDLIVDMIQRAQERGIKIKFVDDLKGSQEMIEIRSPQNQANLVGCAERKLGAMTTADLEKIATDLSREIHRLTSECINEDPALKALTEKFGQARLEGDRKLGKDAADRNPEGRTVFFYGSLHGENIAAGHPGKSIGIAGTNPINADAARETTPFFFFHYNIQSGETTTPSWFKRLLSAAPEQAAPLPA